MVIKLCWLLQVCTELEKMVAAVASFRGFLGPQFISISGEAQVTP